MDVRQESHLNMLNGCVEALVDRRTNKLNLQNKKYTVTYSLSSRVVELVTLPVALAMVRYMHKLYLSAVALAMVRYCTSYISVQLLWPW